MRIRKLVTGSLCLLTMAGSTASAQQGDAFADWERFRRNAGIQDASASAEPAAARPGRTSLRYFAPGESTSEPAPAAESRRESMKPMAESAAAAATAESVAAETPAPPAASGSQTNVTIINRSGAKPAAPVTQASHTAAPADKTAVRTVAAEASDNPFADFLRQEAAGPEQAAAVTTEVAGPLSSAAVQQPIDYSAEQSGAQTPAVTVEWLRLGDLNVGQECACQLVIRNTSDNTVRNVVAEAVLPAGVEVRKSVPAPATGVGSASWTFGELRPGDQRIVELTLVPHQRGDMRMNAFVRFTGFSTSVFSVQEPLLEVSVAGPESIEVGQQAHYVVQVHNPGTGVARNVVIEAAVPEGLEHRRGSLLSIEIGTLSPGESRQAKLSLTALKGGAQQLAVRTLADGGLSDQSVAEVAVAEPQLAVAITGPDARLAGQATEYELVVSNQGKVQSNNVRAKYKLPADCEFVSADRGGRHLDEDGTIEWFVGTLKPGQSSTFRVTLKPTAPGTAFHQAGVISEHGKVTMSDYSTEIAGSADLKLAVTASARRVQPGEETAFEIRIRNTGTSPASSVGVSCELPPGMELIEAQGPAEYIAQNGVMIFRSLPTLEPGKAAVFAVRTRVNREGDYNVRVRVASDSITDPLIGGASTSAATR